MQMNEELHVIDSLLRDTSYALEIAKAQEASYYEGTGQTAPPFLGPGEDTATVTKSVKEEKIAINLAGFYALECGIGILSEQQNTTPYAILDKMVTGKADSGDVFLLNRFANASWKAGQPFRSLERIQRPIFMVFNFLSKPEVDKDYNQIVTAGKKLHAAMQPVSNAGLEEQLQLLKKLLQDTSFALSMAGYLDSSYYVSQNQQAPPFLTPEDATATVAKPVKDQKIATNVAGFYALECGLSFYAAKEKILPSVLLQSILKDSISSDKKLVFLRFANLTWKAGQPFRGLERITRDIFMPARLLPEDEVEKDWVQVKTAAKMLLNTLKAEMQEKAVVEVATN
ncbi:hypothetical protein [Foetidibacter luteolus]|uniref:hypothetical protein n=1 Tax=Foetidibacter luteolus TaxID=2608880 RepID=UPI00129B547B|nr:hypothetical protein [Foetidibacter luteolus]